MGFYTGRTGQLWFRDKPVAKIRDWSLDTTLELLSTNTLTSFSNTFVPSLKGATGSATLLYYRLETGESAQYIEFTELLSKLHKVGAIDTGNVARLVLKTGDLPQDDISFVAYITSASIAVAAGELTTVQIQFTVDGDFETGGVIA